MMSAIDLEEVAADDEVYWFAECGSCGEYHSAGFGGDCRDDATRYPMERMSLAQLKRLAAYRKARRENEVA